MVCCQGNLACNLYILNFRKAIHLIKQKNYNHCKVAMVNITMEPVSVAMGVKVARTGGLSDLEPLLITTAGSKFCYDLTGCEIKTNHFC